MIDSVAAIVQKYESLLSILLVQVALVAMFSSLLLLFRNFKNLVLTSHPTRRISQNFGIVLGIIAAMLSWARIRMGYTGADMTIVLPLISGFIMGLRAGVWTGFIGGIYPARCGEWLTMPVGMAAGAAAGFSLRWLSGKASIWDFTPVPFGNASRAWTYWKTERKLDPLLVVIGVSVQVEVLRTETARMFQRADAGRYLFSFAPDDPVAYYLVIISCLASIGVALKIWNAPRVEARLRRGEALLAEARLNSLRWQMQPHFLFNTLNSISVLVRTNPDAAREILRKLSAILRRLLYHTENVNTLRQELAFVEDYLDIEMVRFGPERLKYDNDIDPAALPVEVPAMILQPLVENSIKHGLSAMELDGRISIRAQVAGERLVISVEDNGQGMSREAATESVRTGIGLNNINERLKSVYGDKFRFRLESEPGSGTLVEITLPATKYPDGAQTVK